MTSVVSKIRKLLALSEGTTSQNEAEVAAALAQRLMAEHAISVHHLDEDALREEDPMGMVAVEIGLASWKIHLAWQMASHCKVEVLRHVNWGENHPTETDENGEPVRVGPPKRRVYATGYGHRSDLQVWEYLFQVAEREIQKAVQAFRKEHPGLNRGIYNRFRMGAVGGLGEVLKKQRAAEEWRMWDQGEHAATTALMRRQNRAEDYCHSKNPRIGKYKGTVRMNHEGLQAGRKIRIGKGIDAKATNRRRITRDDG